MHCLFNQRLYCIFPFQYKGRGRGKMLESFWLSYAQLLRLFWSLCLEPFGGRAGSTANCTPVLINSTPALRSIPESLTSTHASVIAKQSIMQIRDLWDFFFSWLDYLHSSSLFGNTHQPGLYLEGWSQANSTTSLEFHFSSLQIPVSIRHQRQG